MVARHERLGRGATVGPVRLNGRTIVSGLHRARAAMEGGIPIHYVDIVTGKRGVIEPTGKIRVDKRAPRHGDAFGQQPAETTPEFEEKLASFLKNAQALIDLGMDETFKAARVKVNDPTFGAIRLTTQRGPRYIRVVKNDVFGGHARPSGVYVFIDTTNGDILKAASFKTPAKGKRGNIFDENPLDAVTVHGGRYFKR